MSSSQLNRAANWLVTRIVRCHGNRTLQQLVFMRKRMLLKLSVCEWTRKRTQLKLAVCELALEMYPRHGD